MRFEKFTRKNHPIEKPFFVNTFKNAYLIKRKLTAFNSLKNSGALMEPAQKDKHVFVII